MSKNREPLDPEVRTYFHCAIQARDGKRCFYCRRNFRRGPMRRKTIDHYVPYRIWPAWDIDNLVLACEGCNLRKADSLPLTLAWLLLAATTLTQNDLEVAA